MIRHRVSVLCYTYVARHFYIFTKDNSYKFHLLFPASVVVVNRQLPFYNKFSQFDKAH
jgi:hypothetical protein